MELIVTASEMKNAEKAAFEKGLTPLEAMERAGQAVARAVLNKKPRKVLIACGFGNNGGDGFACACALVQNGIDVTVLFKDSVERLSEHARIFYERAKACIRDNDGFYDVCVDAIFGIGFHGEIGGTAKELSEILALQKKNDAYIISADMPSGVNSDNGLACANAVKSDETVTFEYRKLGQLLGDGLDYCGKITVEKIGIGCACGVELCDKCDVLLPERNNSAHKGELGHVGIIAGSVSMEGAGMLCALAALRAGAGKVTLAVPSSCMPFYYKRSPEIMCVPMPSKHGVFKASKKLKAFLQDKDSIVFGPGVGRDNEIKKVTELVIKNCTAPLVIDADGLFYASGQLENVLITPHIGEAARLFGISVGELLADPVKETGRFSKESKACVLLKSAYNLFANGQRTALSHWGCSGMATAGSGDVLAGIAGALCARMPLFDAAVTASYIHGTAGCIAQKAKGAESMIASDICDNIFGAFRSIQN